MHGGISPLVSHGVLLTYCFSQCTYKKELLCPCSYTCVLAAGPSKSNEKGSHQQGLSPRRWDSITTLKILIHGLKTTVFNLTELEFDLNLTKHRPQCRAYYVVGMAAMNVVLPLHFISLQLETPYQTQLQCCSKHSYILLKYQPKKSVMLLGWYC